MHWIKIQSDLRLFTIEQKHLTLTAPVAYVKKNLEQLETIKFIHDEQFFNPAKFDRIRL